MKQSKIDNLLTEASNFLLTEASDFETAAAYPQRPERRRAPTGCQSQSSSFVRGPRKGVASLTGSPLAHGGAKITQNIIKRKGEVMEEKMKTRQAILEIALKGIDNSATVQTYKKAASEFASWQKEAGYGKHIEDIKDSAKTVIQEYTNHLEQEGKSPSTIHTKIAPICKGLGVSMRDIDKPRRSADRITRSRGLSDRAAHDIESARYERAVSLQKVTGIRKSEIERLRGRDLVQVGNHLCVHVERGKGGKETYQRILPQDEETVKRVFSGIEPNQKVFQKGELSPHLGSHYARREHAQDCYKYYRDRLEAEPGYRKQLQTEIKDYWRSMHQYGHGHEKFKDTIEKAYEKFAATVDNTKEYLLRGATREVAEAHGQGNVFDRTALLAVSVFHLSHWRIDTTVAHYIVG